MQEDPISLDTENVHLTLVALARQTSAIPAGVEQVRLVNRTGGELFYFSAPAVANLANPTDVTTAETAKWSVMNSGATETFTISAGHRFIALFSATAGKVSMHYGRGV